MSSRKPTKVQRKYAIQLERKNGLKVMGIQRKLLPVPRGQRKKQRKQRNRVPRINGGIVNQSIISRFPLGNRQGTGFGAMASRQRITVCESEYIGEITVANQPNFNMAYALSMNPGQASTFPWLSTIAKQYEKYRFLELMFVYKPEVTQYTANVNTGKVIMSIDYDASDAAPPAKQNMEDTVPHSDGMPYQTLTLTGNPKEMYQKSDAKYVRPGGLPGSASILDFDCGNFYLATQGQTANSVLGELHVQYCVELSVPVLEGAGSSAPTNHSVAWFQSTTAESSGATTVSKNMAFATATVNNVSAVNTSGSFVLPAGNYLVDVDVFVVNTGAQAYYTADFKVAGVSQFQVLPSGTITGALNYGSPLAFSVYYVSTGSNAVTIPIIATYSSGTNTMWGDIRFTSV